MEHLDAAADPSLTPKALARRVAQRRSVLFAQALSFVIDGVLLLLYFFAGTTPISTPIVYLVGGLTNTLAALFLSEIHFNDRFKDHYLTVPHCVSNITIQLLGIYLAPEVGFYFVCVNFIILGIGSLRMSAQQTGLVWSYSTVGLSALFLLSEKPIAMPMMTWTEHALALACFVTATGRCAFAGLYGSALREALYKSGNELKRAYARIEELADTDELTGTLNRRCIMKNLEQEVVRAQRSGRACTVAMIDLDFFKGINDRFGHPVGDEVLRTFGLILFANIREIDKIGRYGGEEFLLILPEAGIHDAAQAVDRLRSVVAEVDWRTIASGLQVTMSAGAAEVRAGDTSESLLTRADEALYRAKAEGRNRVVAA
jgi:diguanylate cyclase (GGDEF)-like protein